MRPLVSVIVPCYNCAGTVERTLDSLAAQTLKEIELIVINDGSTDNTLDVLNAYKEAHPELLMNLYTKENEGIAEARNFGLRKVTGEYFGFLDSDDYWDPDTIEQLCEIAEKDSLQVLAFAGEPFWDGMEQPELYQDYCHSVQNGIVKTGAESFKTAWECREYYSSPGLRLYLREYLVEKGFRFDEGIIHEDLSHSFLAYVFAERVECIGNRFYKRRFRPGSIMTARSMLRSACGYNTALETLLNDYSTDLTEAEREAFIIIMRHLFHYIRIVYGAAAAQETSLFKGRLTSDSHLIASASKKTLRKARFLIPYLSGKDRIAFYNLETGYLFRILWNRIRMRKQR